MDVEERTLAETPCDASHFGMEWTNVSFQVGQKRILDDVSGCIRPGEMVCIIGPSGAGKSTLLNVLAGRTKTQGRGLSIKGEVSLSGIPCDPVQIRSHIAYVMQEDALPAFYTPREILMMTAVLRSSASSKEAKIQVDALLRTLRLTACADTRIGDALFRGCSGGEKKRTSVGAEFLTHPHMLFLDEPLSGLDSFCAWSVVEVLRELKTGGCAVACTAHQPSSQVYQTFNRCICLANGRVCYGGRQDALCDFLAAQGHPVPVFFNPADHLLFLVQTMDAATFDEFKECWAREEEGTILPEIVQARCSDHPTRVPTRLSRSKSFPTQLWYLLHRQTCETVRNWVGLAVRFGISATLCLVASLIFWRVGTKDETGRTVSGHSGGASVVMIFSMFGSAQPLLLQFAFERPIFLREYASNMYSSVPYFLSKTIVEIPVSLCSSLVILLVTYWSMGFQGNFFLLVLTSLTMSTAAGSQALFLGCCVKEVETAMELAPLLFVPQLMFSGVFIDVDLVPVWMRWLQYVCPLKHSINIFSLVEFQDSAYQQAILDRLDIREELWYVYLMTLAGIIVVFRTLAVWQLRKHAQFVQ
mmetsp:Transcript_31393/g.83516  ORF Transcript_31393/g.83516 Transcript_31393/m.83516 type:complete len:586 (-) Transcript_31393:255-2012(-)